MKTRLAVVMLLLSSLAQAEELIVSIDGQEKNVPCRILNLAITEAEMDRWSLDSAVGTYLQYQGLLAKGDIDAASKLATDPATTVRMMTQYRERLGAEDFKSEMTPNNVSILAELLSGDVTMLVVKTPNYIAAQLLVNADGKYRLISGPPFSDDAKALSKVLNMIRDGTFKLPEK